jgi:hypothetical protein
VRRQKLPGEGKVVNRFPAKKEVLQITKPEDKKKKCCSG